MNNTSVINDTYHFCALSMDKFQYELYMENEIDILVDKMLDIHVILGCNILNTEVGD